MTTAREEEAWSHGLALAVVVRVHAAGLRVVRAARDVHCDVTCESARRTRTCRSSAAGSHGLQRARCRSGPRLPASPGTK